MKTPQFNILLADDDDDDDNCYFFKEALEELPISSLLKIVNDGELLIDAGIDLTVYWK